MRQERDFATKRVFKFGQSVPAYNARARNITLSVTVASSQPRFIRTRCLSQHNAIARLPTIEPDSGSSTAAIELAREHMPR